MPLRGGGRSKNLGGPLPIGCLVVLLFSFLYLKNPGGVGHGPLASPLPEPPLLFWEKRAGLKRAWRALTSYRVNHSHIPPPMLGSKGSDC